MFQAFIKIIRFYIASTRSSYRPVSVLLRAHQYNQQHILADRVNIFREPLKQINVIFYDFVELLTFSIFIKMKLYY